MTIEISPAPLSELSAPLRSVGEAWRDGDFATAIQTLDALDSKPETCLETYLTTVEDRRLVSLLLRLDGRMRESLRVLDADAEESPAVLRLELAHGLADMRRLPAALRILDSLATPDDPNQPLGRLSNGEAELLLCLRGLVLARMERLESARAQLDRIKERGALEELSAVFVLACTHLALRDWEKALGFFQSIAGSAPRWPTPGLAEHRCLLILGRRGEAEARIRALAEVFPRDPRVAMVACAHFELTEQPEEVVRIAEAALEGWPSAQEEEAAVSEADSGSSSKDSTASNADSAGAAKPGETSGARGEAAGAGPEAADAGAARLIRLDIPTRLRLSTVRPLQRLGRSDEAKAQVARIAPGLAEELAEKLAGIDPDAPRGRVSIEPIVQERNMCVAACVAVILNAMREPGEEEVDARAIFAEMGGGHGVANWQLDEWIRARGLQPVDIRQEVDAIRSAIDAGHPLLITSSSALMGHQELLVGYDDGFGEFELVDPEHGLPHHVPYEDLVDRYGTASDTLVALLEPGEGGRLKVPTGWLDETARTRRLIERAANTGKVDKARKHIGSLEPGSSAELVTRLRFPDLFDSKDSARDAADTSRVAVQRKELGNAVRLQAMLGLLHNRHPEVAAAWQELKGDVSPFERSLYYMHRALVRGDWKRLERWTAVLIERAAMIPDLWVLRFKALGGVGRFKESQRALEIAIEIEPTHLEANIESLRFSKLDARERRESLAALTAQHKRSPFLRSIEAGLAMDAGKALEAERILQEAHRQMPGSTEAALNLRQYYVEQNRPDLAAEVTVPGLDEDDAADSTDSADAVELEESSSGRAPVARLIARDVRTLIQQVGAKLSEGEEDAPELRRLLRMRQAGRLSPDDAILVTAMEIQAVRLREGPSRKRLTELLPPSLPEPPAPFAATIIESLLEHGPEPFEAQGLAEWTRARLEGHEWTRHLRYLVAALDELGGLRGEAEEVYTELAEDGHGLAMFRLGRMALEEGRLVEAERHFVAGLKRNPAHIGSHLSLFELAGRREQRDRAIVAMRRLTELRPYDPDIAGMMVSTLRGEDTPADRRAVKDWLEANGERYPAAFVDLMKVQLVIRDDAEEARAAITDVLRREKPQLATEIELECLERTLSATELEVALDEALESFPDSYPLTQMKANRLVKSHGKADALALHLDLFKRSPNPGSVEFLLTNGSARGVKSLAKAVVAIEDTKRRRAAWFLTLEVLQEQQNVPAILAFAEHVAIHRPDDLEVRETMLRALAASGQAGPLGEPLAKYLEDGGKDCDTLAWCAAVVASKDLELARRAFSRAFNETRRPEFLVQAGHCETAAGRPEAELKMLGDYLKQVGTEPCILSRLMVIDEKRIKEHFEAACELIRDGPVRPSGDFPLQVALTAVAVKQRVPERWIEWTRSEARKRKVRGRTDELAEVFADMQELWAAVRPEEGREPIGPPVTSRLRRIHAGEPWSASTIWIPGSLGERPLRFDPDTAAPRPRIKWDLPIRPTPGVVFAQRVELAAKFGLVLAAIIIFGVLSKHGAFGRKPPRRRPGKTKPTLKPERPKGTPGQRIRGAAYALEQSETGRSERRAAIATLIELLEDPEHGSEARKALFGLIQNGRRRTARLEAVDALLRHLREKRLSWDHLDTLADELMKCQEMWRPQREDDVVALYERWFELAGTSASRQDRVLGVIFQALQDRNTGRSRFSDPKAILRTALGKDKSLVRGAPRERLLREGRQLIARKPSSEVARFLVARIWQEAESNSDKASIEAALRMEAESRSIAMMDDAEGRSQRQRLALLRGQASSLKIAIQKNQAPVRGLPLPFLDKLCAALGLEPVSVLRQSR